MNIDLKTKKILVTGASGFLGSHLLNQLVLGGVPKENISTPSSQEFDLRKWENCERVVRRQDIIFHLAAKVGGIGFNQEKPGELFYDNLVMGAEMMEAARVAGVQKFVAIGTVCAYPKFAPVPFKEDDLWNGYPEETNASYGLAKKMLLVQAQAYRQQYGLNAIYLLPANLYGPGDNFDLKSSHVIPALIKKVIEAKSSNKSHVEIWGSGQATREFLYVEDAASGIILAAERYDKSEPVNLGIEVETSIKDLALLISRLLDYKGEIVWDTSKPDGQPRRTLDVSRAKKEFDFEARVSLEEGLRKTIEWARENIKF